MSNNTPFSTNSTDIIASKINSATIQAYKTKLTPLLTQLEHYDLIITGTIGAGKSTLCESITYIITSLFPGLSLSTFPEFLFIDPEIAGTMLELRLSKQITVATFQSYILDNWEKALKQASNKTSFRIFERCVDDCVICFANLANKHNEMSDQFLLSLYERMKLIDQQYNIPTYLDFDDRELHFTEINSSDLNFNLLQILDIITCDLNNKVTSRIIGLSVSSFDSEQRIKQRSRDGESAYDKYIIDVHNTHYKKLFKLLAKGNRIKRFLDLGQLF